MFLHSLATAVPPAVFTQRQCWEVSRDSAALQRLNRRSQLILRAILTVGVHHGDIRRQHQL